MHYLDYFGQRLRKNSHFLGFSCNEIFREELELVAHSRYITINLKRTPRLCKIDVMILYSMLRSG